jgi:hypothetical protein
MPTPVAVTVNTSGPTPSVTVSPDPVEIAAGDRSPIQWKITNPAPEGWKFQMQGVVIRNPGTEFDRPNGGGTRVFTWNNNHTKAGTYKYAVKVDNGTTRAEIDPQIVNH